MEWDVAVVGAGPAGSLAALAAASAGARTILIERHAHPRYKVCGGGLIGASLDALPEGFAVPVRERITSAALSRDLGRTVTRTSDVPFLSLVNRADLDAGLAACAVDAGVQLQEGIVVEGLEEVDAGVTLRTTSGPIRARAVVGADGSASRIARHVGVQTHQVDLGLEVELAADAESIERFGGRVALDFGGPSGAYAWVFPKGDTLTVGAIAGKGSAAEERRYLDAFLAQQGLDHLPVLRDGGHLTRCRTDASPLGLGRVLVAGDAAGLLEPWTREGISFALRSGRLAGIAAAAMALGAIEPADAVAEYERTIAATLGEEMTAGTRALRAYGAHRGAFTRVLSSRRGWRAFERLCRGQTSILRMEQHLSVQVALGLLSGRSRSRSSRGGAAAG